MLPPWHLAVALRTPEMAQLVALLEERGLVEVYLDEQGREAYRLTEGGRSGRDTKLATGETSHVRLPVAVGRRCRLPSASAPGNAAQDGDRVHRRRR